jgi:hydroxymethylbilane synthase
VTKTGCGLAGLPAGARVGTSSLRRAVGLKEARPDLVIDPIRGNVDTRIRKVMEGPYDAVVLALAGIKRLGWADRASEILSPEVSLPAIGQGALGIECRSGDTATAAVLRTLQHARTAIAVAAERAVMAAVDGSCKMPVAAFAERKGGELYLRAMLAEPDGTRVRRGERSAPWPERAEDAERIGRDLGLDLKSR